MKTRAIEVHVYQNVQVVDIGGVVLPDGVDIGYAGVTVLQAGQQGEANHDVCRDVVAPPVSVDMKVGEHGATLVEHGSAEDEPQRYEGNAQQGFAMFGYQVAGADERQRHGKEITAQDYQYGICRSGKEICTPLVAHMRPGIQQRGGVNEHRAEAPQDIEYEHGYPECTQVPQVVAVGYAREDVDDEIANEGIPESCALQNFICRGIGAPAHRSIRTVVQQVYEVHEDAEPHDFFCPACRFRQISFARVGKKEIAGDAKEGGRGYADKGE